MLPEKNGFKSVRRSAGKSLLFFLLLTALTAVLSLGICIYHAVTDYLADCDRYYQTIAALEYIGHSYPDSGVYDETLEEALQSGALDTEAMASLPGVLRWEPDRAVLGVIDGLTRTDKFVDDSDTAVLLVSGLFYDQYGGAYGGNIEESLYSLKDHAKVLVFFDPSVTFDLSQTNRAVMIGHFFHGDSGYLWFFPEDTTIELDGETITLSGYTMMPEEELPADSPYYAAADYFRTRNNGVRVQLVTAPEEFLPFQQGRLTLTEGRIFTAEEAAQGARVCVIPDRIAAYLDIDAGDSIDLSLLCSNGSIYEIGSAREVPSEPYTVTGVYAATEEYPDWVFVPGSVCDFTPNCPTGFQVGQFRLENARADEFYEEASKLLPRGFRLTVYDQGYGIVAEPFQDILQIMQVFLLVCGLVIAAALLLFGYLFVRRQKDAAQTMLALGSGRLHIYRYFAAACGSIVLLASILGAAVGSLLEQRVLQAVAAFAEAFETADIRFSAEAVTALRTLEFRPQTPTWLYMLSAAIMTLGALLVCAAFTASTLAEKKPRKRKKARAPRFVLHSSRLSGRLKYAALSVRRGGGRTVTVLLFAAVMTLFLGQLSSTSDVYRRQLAQIRSNSVIRCYATDIAGRGMNGLVVPGESLQKLYDTGLLSSMDVSAEISNYRFVGVVSDPDGTPYSLEPSWVPVGEYQIETYQKQMSNQPTWVATTSLTNSPEFYYRDPEITWLEGFDERCLRGPAPDVCLLPETMMEREGIALGSTIRVQTGTVRYFYYEDNGTQAPSPWEASIIAMECDLLVVGSYQLESVEETIYSPFKCLFPLGTEPGPVVERADNSPTLVSAAGTTEYFLFLVGNREMTPMEGLPVEFFNAETPIPLQDELLACLSDENYISFDSTLDPIQCMTEQTAGECYCVVSGDFFRDNFAELTPQWCADNGAKLRLYVRDDNDTLLLTKIIGCFEKTSEKMGDIYCSPFAYSLGNQWDIYSYTERDTEILLPTLTCESAVFSLRSTNDLEALRDAMEACGFTSVGSPQRLRSYAVIDDAEFNSTVRTLNRQIRYLDMLYSLLYALSAILTLTLSFLLMLSRKKELAIMRGLGTQPTRIFFSFLTEQLILAVLGCGVCFGIRAACGGMIKPFYLYALGAFVVLWVLGTGAALVHLIRSKALAALSDRE